MIKIKSLHKKYSEKEVLKGINLNVEKGQVVVILGPSGSGKTTLLRCLNFLEKADKGEMYFGKLKIDFEKVSSKDIEEVRKKSSMVFQNYALFLNKTALQNITESLISTRKYNKEDANKKGKALLKAVGLENNESSYPHQMSGGQQQRVGIARALAVDPELILFDEPTSSLDPLLVNEVLSIIKQVAKQNITTIIVTHEIGFAYDVADKIVFMDNGKVVEEGSPDEVLKNPQNNTTKRFLENTQKTLANLLIID